MYALIYIIIGGFFEPSWVIAMTNGSRATDKNKKMFWYAACLFLEFCSLMFLSFGMKEVDMGIAYAVWTAIGAIVTIALSKLIYKEKVSVGKAVAILMILIGISGLELAGGL